MKNVAHDLNPCLKDNLIIRWGCPFCYGQTTILFERERQAVEKKKIKSWCKSVSAFANTFGGSLIFGISNDDDEIVGITDTKGDSEFISQKIKERISPIPAFNLRFEMVDGKKLIIVDVPVGKDTPYYYVGDGI